MDGQGPVADEGPTELFFAPESEKLTMAAVGRVGSSSFARNPEYRPLLEPRKRLLPRYVYIYDGWRHGEQHPDDRAAVEAVDEMKQGGALIRVERVPSESEPVAGGSAPECRHERTPPAAEVVWRAGEGPEGEPKS